MHPQYPPYYHPEPEVLSSLSGITVKNWQQFKEVDITFHPNLTILTGANGAGKTTLFNILAKHFDWYFNNLAIKNQQRSVTRNAKIKVKRYEGVGEEEFEEIGTVSYENSTVAKIVTTTQIPINEYGEESDSPAYTVELLNKCKVHGLFIPSHRPVYTYQALESIPVRPNEMSKKKALEQLITELRNKVLNVNNQAYGQQPKTTNYRIKETLTAWNAFGYKNEKSKGRKDFIENFERFESILKKLLPETLKFKGLRAEDGEIILDCDTKPFYIDSASGGITSIIDIAWQIFMYHEDKNKRFIVIIDEIENHLHPALQRLILPKLVKAFPNVKFIVSTHSPLMVNSVRDSFVYALKYDKDEVVSVKLDLQNKAKSSSQILDEVLGVSFNMPIWAEAIVDKLVSSINDQNISDQSLKNLRRDLSGAGLENLMPEAIEKLVKEND